jgi:hypothetical protein
MEAWNDCRQGAHPPAHCEEWGADTHACLWASVIGVSCSWHRPAAMVTRGPCRERDIARSDPICRDHGLTTRRRCKMRKKKTFLDFASLLHARLRSVAGA